MNGKVVDDKIAQISMLEMKQSQLEAQIEYVAARSYSRVNEVNEELALIDEEIEAINQELYDLGAAKPSETMINKLVDNQNGTVFKHGCRNGCKYAIGRNTSTWECSLR